MKRAALPVLLVTLAACTAPKAAPAPPASASPSPSPSVAPSPTLPRAPRFSAARAMATVRSLAALGPRESESAAYRRAASLVARRFEQLGYQVERQRFRLPPGRNDGIQVSGGPTLNIVARPPGLRPTDEQVVVGAHLDTTPDSPGANDNASGVAVVLELARMAAQSPPRVPAVFVAFAGEERVRRTPSDSVFAEGSHEYVRRLSKRETRAVAGMINIDMVGSGRVRVMGKDGPMVRLAQRAARAIDVPARRDTTFFYSDHLSFDRVGIPSVWLWTGEHDSLHTPQDVASVVRRSSLAATGRVAWATLRRVRG